MMPINPLVYKVHTPGGSDNTVIAAPGITKWKELGCYIIIFIYYTNIISYKNLYSIVPESLAYERKLARCTVL